MWSVIIAGWLLGLWPAGQVGAAPTAHTHLPQFTGSSSARLCGMVNPGGAPTVAWFEWGTGLDLGQVTTMTDVGAGSGVVWVSAPIGGLAARQAYYCRLVASNSSGVVRGNVQIFGANRIVAWGFNGYGQTSVPRGLSNVVAVAGGGYHSLALQVDQILWPPVILTQPASRTNWPGSTATFRVEAVGPAPLSYQWRKGNVEMAGETNATLVLTNVQPVQAGDYSVVITNALGAVTSTVARLTVGMPWLDLVAPPDGGPLQLILHGEPGRLYAIETSTIWWTGRS